MVDAAKFHAGLRLRRTREFRGLQQRDFARMLGLRVQDLDRVEQGAARLEGAILFAAATALGVDPSFFFRRLKHVGGVRTNAVFDWSERCPACLNDNIPGVRKPPSRPELRIVGAKARREPGLPID